MKPVYLKPFLLVAFIVLFDQIIKTWVRTHMYMGQDIQLNVDGTAASGAATRVVVFALVAS